MTDREIAKIFGVGKCSVSLWVRLPGAPQPPFTVRGHGRVRHWRTVDLAALRRWRAKRAKLFGRRKFTAGPASEAAMLFRHAKLQRRDLAQALDAIRFSPREQEIAKSATAKTFWPEIARCAAYREQVAAEFQRLMESKTAGV